MTFEKMQMELTSAIKEKNKEKKLVIADIINTAKYTAIEQKKKDNVTEDIVDSAILKVKKTYQEQIDTCPKDRYELLKTYQNKMSYINEYAPIMLTKDEIQRYIYIALISGAVELNKPSLMKYLMSTLKGKADGKLVNEVVTEFLK